MLGKRMIGMAISVMLAFSVFAAGSKESSSQKNDVQSMSFAQMTEAARGTTVSFYGWGGDEALNKWLDTVFAAKMKEKYDITMKRVPMDIDLILSKLSGELAAGKANGTIDMIWINGENFKSAKQNNMLFGPFTEKLPNYAKYLDGNNPENTTDFGFPIEGYEAPYGRAQLVLIHDSAVTPDAPKNTAELLAFAKKYKGKVTYPALPDFTGSAFVRNIICDICGYEQFQTMKEDKATVKKAIEPALAYLRELKPYLWKEGKTYPASSVQLNNMFMDGEAVLHITYSPFAVARAIQEGKYPETAQSFVFEKGTVGNTNFIAVAKNAPNKAGAMLAINEMMSAEIQHSRYSNLKTLPVIDNNKLSAAEKKLFEDTKIGKGVLPQGELLQKRIPEMPAGLVPIIEEIWLEEVAGK